MKCVKLILAATLLVSVLEGSSSLHAQAINRAPSQTATFLDSEAAGRGTVSLPASSLQQPLTPISGVDFKISTLGVGGDLSLAFGNHVAVRTSAHKLDFKYPFSIDGITYDSTFRLQSVSATIDWYPKRGNLHISPGVLYFRNNLSAIASVPPGNSFELGTDVLLNSVEDPLHGTAAVVFPRRIAPMLTVGLRNVVSLRKDLPRRGFVVPLELGFAYTGPAEINVVLNGTACMGEDCFTFAQYPDAQAAMKKELIKLNNRLQSFPVYPIASVGFGYFF